MNSVEAIVFALEHAKERLGMYMHPQDVKSVLGFLAGFQVSCRAFGYNYDGRIFEKVYTRRGWERRGSLVELVSQKTGLNMNDGGMSEQEIIAELFAIEIECWREVPGV